MTVYFTAFKITHTFPFYEENTKNESDKKVFKLLLISTNNKTNYARCARPFLPLWSPKVNFFSISEKQTVNAEHRFLAKKILSALIYVKQSACFTGWWESLCPRRPGGAWMSLIVLTRLGLLSGQWDATRVCDLPLL